jgi:hypothetical protein
VILYIGIAAATVLAAVIVNKEEDLPEGTRGALLRRSCFFLIALILVVPAVLRQETGNDYLRYVEFFHLASIDAYVPTETGFNLLVKATYALCGYENYLLVFAVFAVLTIVLMLEVVRRQAENYAFSFFLFMMFGYYFQSFNTMRYYLALSIALTAMTCLLKRRYPEFVLLILAAALFHKSALAALLLYPASIMRWKRIYRAAAAGIGVGVLLLRDKVLQLLVALYPSWEGTEDLAAGTSVSWVNILRCAGVLLLFFFVLRMQDGADGTVKAVCGEDSQRILAERKEDLQERQLRMYLNGSFLGLLMYVFGWFIPEISRICYYVTFTQVFLIPMLLQRIPDGKKRERKWLTALVIAAAVLYFALFLKTAYRDTIKILPYKSFLFHELNQTPSGSVN